MLINVLSGGRLTLCLRTCDVNLYVHAVAPGTLWETWRFCVAYCQYLYIDTVCHGTLYECMASTYRPTW